MAVDSRTMRDSTNATIDDTKVIAADLRYLTVVFAGFSECGSIFRVKVFGAGDAAAGVEVIMAAH